MVTLLNIIIATLFVSLLSFAGLFIFSQKAKAQKIMEATISLAAAVLLANVFFELLPELMSMSQAQNQNDAFQTVSAWILVSIILFILAEKYLHWHHCHHHHDSEKNIHPMGYNVLIGDGLHNFVDGMVIASSFMLGTNIGLITTVAIALHEIPQEVGDFSLLLHAGFNRTKALIFNFISGMLAVLGGISAFFYGQSASHQLALTALATGSFLYISLSDIIPRLHQQNSKHYLQQLIWFFIGLVIVFLANRFFHE
ncbi:MAG: ZIP family metal transporter [Patescibacteria group bacterium]